jgi:hypothetical protein
MRPARVQVDCWAASHAEANALADAVIEALVPAHETGGARFGRSFVDGKRDFPERVEAKLIHRVSVDLMINYYADEEG